MSLTFDLSSFPLEPATHVLEANAGSGKTYALCGLFLKLVLCGTQQGQPLELRGILTMTYTVAATDELKDRLRRRLAALEADLTRTGDSTEPAWQAALATGTPAATLRQRLRLAAASLDEAAIHTIHGFCQRVLQEHALRLGLDPSFEVAPDLAAEHEELAADLWRRHFLGDPERIGLAHAVGLDPFRLGREAGQLAEMPDRRHVRWGQPHRTPKQAADLEVATQALAQAWDAYRSELRQSGQALVQHLQGGNIKRGKESGWPGTEVASLATWIASLHAATALDPTALAFARRLTPDCLTDAISKRINRSEPPPSPCPPGVPPAAEALLQAAADWEATCALLWEQAFLQELPHQLRTRGQLGYGDLVQEVHRALQGPEGAALAALLRRRYPVVLVDESQDTDPRQMAIFQTAFGNDQALLCFIGDPKQAIYGFRGADLHTYLGARDAAAQRAPAQAPRIHHLDQNWRSRPDYVAAINGLYQSHPAPFGPGIAYVPSRPAVLPKDEVPLRLPGEPNDAPCLDFIEPPAAITQAEKAEAKGQRQRRVAAELAQLLAHALLCGARLGEQPLAPRDCAILVRRHTEAALVEEALRDAAIPCVRRTDASVFASEEATNLAHLLRGLLQLKQAGTVRLAIASGLLGPGLLDGKTPEVLLDQGGAAHDAALTAVQERFAQSAATWAGQGILPALGGLVLEAGNQAHLAVGVQGERRLTNLLHLAELLHQEERAQRRSPQSLLAWLEAQRSAADEGSPPEEHLMRLESDADAVRIITQHQSKGLQYPWVLLPFVADDMPTRAGQPRPLDYHENGQRVRDFRTPAPDSAKDQATAEANLENARLLYVALTRAVSRCTLWFGRAKEGGKSSLSRLLQAGEEAQLEAGRRQQLLQAAGRGLRFAPLESLTSGQAPATPAPAAAPPPLEPTPWPTVTAPRRTLSFSGLMASIEREAPDHDAASAAPPPTLPDPDEVDPFTAFPRGANGGSCFHHLMENLPFDADLKQARTAAQQSLRLHGIAETLAEALAARALHWLQTPLPAAAGPDFRLAEIAPADRSVELGFLLELQAFGAPALAQVFAQAHGPAGALAAPLGRLQLSPNEGWLRGFIDLVVRYREAYYILDWKTNHLGPEPGAYGADGLRAAIDEAGYALQYHLYALALRRHLRRSLPDYDEARHFGGVRYLFVRGVRPGRPELGIFADRPDAPTLDRLEALLVPSSASH